MRAILDEECARGLDPQAIERGVTRREASAIWGLTGVPRRAQLLQRGMLYADEPDTLAAELVRYRAVTPAAIDAVIARWLPPGRHVEIETVPARRAQLTGPASAA